MAQRRQFPQLAGQEGQRTAADVQARQLLEARDVGWQVGHTCSAGRGGEMLMSGRQQREQQLSQI